MNKFAEMTTYVSVVEASSFSEAARRLGTTKSQVSQRIRQLEQRLGCILLNRTRPLSLTEAGSTYYEHSLRLLQELERLEERLAEPEAGLRGQLSLSAPLAFTPRYLAPMLARFAERYPQLRVDVQADDRMVNLQDPHFDMALRLGRLGDSCLVARPITANRHLICASPDYLERHGVPRHPEDLQRHDGLVYYHREPGGMLSLPLDGQQASFRVRVRMRTDSGHQLLEGARAGLGLAILPSFLAADALLAGELLPVLEAYTPSGGHVSVVYRKTRKTSQKILALGRFLEEEIGDPAPWDRLLIERGLLAPLPGQVRR
ncbi:LysR family transcriptional regulator [Pseudomonas aeruginosa]|uniref:LysR family transcriptional regulator n=1 Tax=Pseudomonas aeruginosa group TaxID=136841 RepID=UPI00071BF2C8|nr:MULTISPECIES: LysR family transcriptional regulator [Pseudomonas aeruginosa group]KSP83151.1 LysR family transcriptional regulator [Pseudomonas aeruginosa]MCW8021546.1 LysR family transcriptional regulator [Pseudomonas aeruginosa]RTT31517.1 LysR family transcriptional regulator [Pseudomonas paraeruginosa]